MSVLTLGIEEEYQIIDPVSRDLRSHMEKIVEGGRVVLKERVKQEMHQAVVEVGTHVCQNIQQAREEVTYLRSMIAEFADKQNLKIGAAGTHPFSRWQDQDITNDPRYDKIVEEMQDTARSNLIFGLHVHVGIENREIGMQIMNSARYFLPHIFALSVNSPFWEGRNTGFHSFRTKVFDKFPRTGIPDFFANVSEYDSYINLLIKTGCIDNGKKIWWDIRLHPFYQTIEFRQCDVPMRVDETITLAALMQALVYKLNWLIKRNLNTRTYRRALINENKWRAARYGITGKLIDFGIEQEVATKDLVYELIDFVKEGVDALGLHKEIDYLHTMLERGTGAQRQLRVFDETGGDLKKVVDYIIAETNYGL
jgi:carboxylate-amine ligase